MAICCALIKHKYQNFSLIILEYCEVSELLIREKHYWGILTPEYNISQDPTAPMSGRKHSNKTKTKISDAHIGLKKGENHHNYGQTLSDETRNKITLSMPSSIKIEVIDSKNNTTTSYDSINEAARALNINNARIVMYFSRNQKSLIRSVYF